MVMSENINFFMFVLKKSARFLLSEVLCHKILFSLRNVILKVFADSSSRFTNQLLSSNLL